MVRHAKAGGAGTVNRRRRRLRARFGQGRRRARRSGRDCCGRSHQGRDRADSAGHHDGRQSSLRRIDHAAAGKRRPHQRDHVSGGPAGSEGCTAGDARSGDAARGARAGQGQLRTGKTEIRSRRRSRATQLHFRTGQGRSGKQRQGGGGDRAAGRGQAREDRYPRPVQRHHRLALGLGRRLREGRRRPRQSGIDRSAQGRLPRPGNVPGAGAGRAAAADRARRDAGQDVHRQGDGGESADRRRRPLDHHPRAGGAIRTRRCAPACSPASG